MALTGYKVIQANSATALNVAIAAEIVLGNSPVGPPSRTLLQAYPEKWTYSQGVAVGIATVSYYKVFEAVTTAALVALINTEISGGAKLLGGTLANVSEQNKTKANFAQAVYKGTAADAGGSASVVGAPAIGDVTGLQAALDAKADLTAGTVPVAQLPVATNAAKGIASFDTGTTVTAGVVTVP